MINAKSFILPLLVRANFVIRVREKWINLSLNKDNEITITSLIGVPLLLMAEIARD